MPPKPNAPSTAGCSRRTRARARLLKPGTMVVSQPAIPVPLVVTFPFPPWATRKEEVAAGAGDDPFAGL